MKKKLTFEEKFELKELRRKLKEICNRKPGGYGDSVNDNLGRRELSFRIDEIKGIHENP